MGKVQGAAPVTRGEKAAKSPSSGTAKMGGNMDSYRHGKVRGDQTGVGGSTSESIDPRGETFRSQ